MADTTALAPAHAAPHAAAPRSTGVIAALTVAALAYSVQQTLVVPALPILTRDLHTSTTWGTWILTGFLLSASVLTPVLGKLGDQYGKERLLLVSLAVFLLATVGATFAWDIRSLIAFRILQGTGGAVFPLSFAIMNDELPRERVPVGIGLVSGAMGVGGGVAIVASGLVVDHLSWRWLFGLGAVGIVLALFLVWRLVPESPVKTPSRVDALGATLLSLGLVALLVALSEGGSWGWTTARTLGLFAAAAVLFVIFGLVERHIDQPMVDMHVFTRRSVLLTNITAFVAGFAMFLTFVLVPAFVEAPRGLPSDVARLVHYGFGASPTRAGLYLLPGSLAMFVAAPVAGMIGRRLGFRIPLAAGMVIVALGSALLAVAHSRPWQLVAAMIVVTIGVGFAFSTMPTLITRAVDRRETGVATGMNTVMRNVGGVVGGEIGAVLITARTLGHTGVPAEGGYVDAFWLGAGAALVGAAVALLVVERRSES
jgi:EmrB/QacA subfamily drug resistance transporter